MKGSTVFIKQLNYKSYICSGTHLTGIQFFSRNSGKITEEADFPVDLGSGVCKVSAIDRQQSLGEVILVRIIHHRSQDV